MRRLFFLTSLSLFSRCVVPNVDTVFKKRDYLCLRCAGIELRKDSLEETLYFTTFKGLDRNKYCFQFNKDEINLISFDLEYEPDSPFRSIEDQIELQQYVVNLNSELELYGIDGCSGDNLRRLGATMEFYLVDGSVVVEIPNMDLVEDKDYASKLNVIGSGWYYY